jgi:hypothetical protein
MGLLARRQRLGLVLAAGLAAGVGGCFAFEDGGHPDEPRGLAFSHRIHAEELDCTDCHAGAEDAEEPGMPLQAQCMLCHAELDREKPPERQVESLFEGGRYKRTSLSALSDEVLFSHAAHVAAGASCADCHGALEQSDALGPEVAVDMAECRACHLRQPAPPDECSACHKVIGTDWKPPGHELQWKEMHGAAARAELGGPSNDCALCHTESTCTACHRTEAPQNHTNHWRRRGHGLQASVDRVACATCHRSDFCDRCHRETEPISHTGMWGGTLSMHCLSCHFPLSVEEGCGVCHKSTPSHLQAPPKPPDHVPGMNCLQCHGLSAPLPHVDKGDDCNMCHK